MTADSRVIPKNHYIIAQGPLIDRHENRSRAVNLKFMLPFFNY